MNKVIFLFFIAVLPLSAQEAADTLTAKRKIFTSAAYLKGVKLNNSMLFDLYSRSKAYDAEKRLKDSRIIIPVGAGVSLAGLALSAGALVGTQHTEIINNVEYTYFKRPVVQVLGGIGLLAAGICLMEFGNDKRMQSIALYNKKKKFDALQAQVGLTSDGALGLKLSF